MSPETAEVLEKISVMLTMNTLPEEDVLWDAEECAHYLKVKDRQFRERICCRQDFPRAVKIGGARRWYRQEILEYARKQRER